MDDAQSPYLADLDPAVIAINKTERIRRYNTVQIPGLRLLGVLLLCAVVLLYQSFVDRSTGAGWTVPLLITYALVSWVCLYLLYGKLGPVDVGLLFLIVDAPVFTVAIYATGGEHSWLFIIYLLRVIDQTHTSFRRALFFGQFVTGCYTVMVLYLQQFEHHDINWAGEIGKIFLIDASCLYASFVALAVEKSQKRIKASFRNTRELAQQLKEKSGQLEASHSEILRAKDAAEAANIAKSQFLATMSHELRTPMNAILGMLHLLQSTELSARQRDYAGKSEGSAKALLSLINDILDFSKVEAGKLTLEQEPFRLDNVLRDLAVVLSANVGAKDIEVLFDIDPLLPSILRGDALRLYQVLLNLASNAIKFTSQGEVVMLLRQKSRTPTSVEIEFSLRDTGIGIAPEHQQAIFGGFSQAEASTTRRFGGTGLGLAISKRIVDLMGSGIQLESTPGVGSVFSFVVQFPIVENELPSLGEVTSPDAERASALTVPRRVLLIEDHDVAAVSIMQMIASWGWMVERAHDGALALAMIEIAKHQEFPYPLIYTKWGLPGMDGWELTHKIRELAEQMGCTQPTVIMITGHGRQLLSQRTEQEQSLINGFVTKPMTSSMLLDAYAEVQAGSSGIRKLTREHSSLRQLAGMRILVVEDNLINQQVADELLSSEGAIVSMAANGQQGVDAVKAAAPQFDVVLMDIQMPVLDGYQATRLIRQEPHLNALPIVAMTANAMASDRDACLLAGMNEHIGKPFELTKLVSLLIRITRFSAVPSEAHVPWTVGESEALVEIPGLDLSTALARMSGMRHLYARTARDFCRVLASCGTELREFMHTEDANAMRMLLHTLKGNAATLGVKALAAHAAEMESLSKSGIALENLAEPLDRLDKLMAQARDSLTQASLQLDPQAPPPTTEVLTRKEIYAQAMDHRQVLTASQTTCLRELDALLEASNLEALQYFAENRVQIQPHGALFDALDRAFQELDLAQAHRLCSTALASVSQLAHRHQ
jgi:signal transduction histidine kinase/DNA-binding response OmpR family regulator/HPt (histidine-containing phosphotransfer) domain-containing protein